MTSGSQIKCFTLLQWDFTAPLRTGHTSCAADIYMDFVKQHDIFFTATESFALHLSRNSTDVCHVAKPVTITHTSTSQRLTTLTNPVLLKIYLGL